MVGQLYDFKLVAVTFVNLLSQFHVLPVSFSYSEVLIFLVGVFLESVR